MAEKLTEQQEAAVYNRGGNLLVSAAAGSGKTKVLTERLLSYILDENDPANIDDFLIITFTKAAAAELRVKIAEKLTDAIAADPTNQHLQRQMQRLHMAHISTVDSYCTDLIKEFAYKLDVSSDFRMVDASETPELQQRVMDSILERAYERIDEDEGFYALTESQGFGRNDKDIGKIVINVYEKSRCNLHPDKWLDACAAAVLDDTYTDAAKTPWGEYLISNLKNVLHLHINTLTRCRDAAVGVPGMSKVPGVMECAISQYEQLCNAENWDEFRERREFKYTNLTFEKKDLVDFELQDLIKATYKEVKDDVKSSVAFLDVDNATALEDLTSCGLAASGLIALVKEFAEEYGKLKRTLRVMDFSDLNHKVLDLLMGKFRSGPTAAAREIGARYREVMVDEYQDSNQVQDSIYMALTAEKNNCFMVGDVKQSIYQFRLAEPGIFIDKYNSYKDAKDAAPGENRRILLSNNFRSSGEIIDCVNDVFERSMSERVGGLDYGPDERLEEGAPHASLGEPEVEFLAVETQDDTYYEESLVVAKRILELIDGSHMIRDKKTRELRPIRLEDIAILIRTRNGLPHLKRALDAVQIPYVTADAEDILCCTEISVLQSLLKVINNPMQDIPLAAVLCSSLFRYTADDMARLRSLDKYASVYQLLRMDSSEKSVNFLKVLDELRTDSRIYSVSQLLDNILQKTHFDSIYGAMSDGMERVRHIQDFLKIASGFESNGGKDLRQFITHLEAMGQSNRSNDKQIHVASAVQITTIHKSKGLEYPVVFCINLSRMFTSTNIAKEKVLCDRELGLGLYCFESKRRVRYPAISRLAVYEKAKTESISEELRVLYVALTRARDRLIMTYGKKDMDAALTKVVRRIAMLDNTYVSAFPGNAATWVFQAALCRTEAGPLFALGGNPGMSTVSEKPWNIQVVTPPEMVPIYEGRLYGEDLKADVAEKLKAILDFRYPYIAATKLASKQTATQIKGRTKDAEVSEAAGDVPTVRYFRKPTFVSGGFAGKEYGNAYHGVMQYVRYEEADTLEKLRAELDRLEAALLITSEQRKMINPMKIVNFVCSPIGRRLVAAEKVHREFKFSILTDAVGESVSDEQILLQGVVDCMMIEPDGITVVDFKSDRFDPKDLSVKLEEHRPQVEAYAKAVERIFKKPVKEKVLYFFSIDQAANL